MIIRKEILVVGGSYSRNVFATSPGFIFKFINYSGLRFHNLYGYIAVIIGSQLNEVELGKCRHKLTNYIRKGGILVCLGCSANLTQWIPYCHWNKANPGNNINGMDDVKDYNNILKEIDLNYLRFHGDFISHGTLEPPSNARILLTGDTKPILTIIEEDVKGAALITTLDPDYHIIAGMKWKNNINEDDFKRNAKSFIENILNWCVVKYNDKHGVWGHLWRSFLGIFSLQTIYLLLSFILCPVSIWAMAKYFMAGNYDSWVSISGTASIIGLAIMIFDKYLQKRASIV